MNEAKLRQISLIISITGTLILLILSEYSQPTYFLIKDLTDEKLESKVRLQGEIISISETPEVTFLKLKDQTGIINLVVFDKIDLKKGSIVEVKGILEKYQGGYEILTDKITSLQ